MTADEANRACRDSTEQNKRKSFSVLQLAQTKGMRGLWYMLSLRCMELAEKADAGLQWRRDDNTGINPKTC